MSVCRGCGEPLPKPLGRRIWCSERCRRQHTYIRHCLDCDKQLTGTEGHGPNAPSRCVSCSNAKTARDRAWPRWERIQNMRAEGLLNVEIARRLGVSSVAISSAVAYMRSQGWDVAPTAYGPTRARKDVVT